MVEERLQNNISFRGPDLPFANEKCEYKCCGTASTHSTSSPVVDDESDDKHYKTVNLFASVLHMQGSKMTKQPLLYSFDDDDDGDRRRKDKLKFCWNGEAYCIEPMLTKNSKLNLTDCDGRRNKKSKWFDIVNSNLDKRDEKKEESFESDTKIVLDYIASNVFFKCEEKEEEATNANGDQCKSKKILNDFANALSHIQGEYSFILHHDCHYNNQGYVYFGRDPLGRRSLLMSSTTNDNGELMTSHDHLIVSSVGLTNDLRQINDHCEIATSFPGMDMEELPAGRVYCLNLSTGNLTFESIRTIPSHSATDVQIRNVEINETKAELNSHYSIEDASETLHTYLNYAIARRVIDAPLTTITSHDLEGEEKITSNETNKDKVDSSVAILFSGGVDSVVLAALCHDHIPKNQAIDLINVAFANTTIHPSHKNDDKKKNSNKMSKRDIESLFEASPDRQAALLSFQEMKIRWPNRKWRFIAVNVGYDEVLEHETTICTLISPLTSTMDFNIGTAFWFASRGRGILRDLSSVSNMNQFKQTKALRFSHDSNAVKKVKSPCSKKKCDKLAQHGCIFGACKLCCGMYQRPICQYLGGRANLCDTHNAKKKIKVTGTKLQNDCKTCEGKEPRESNPTIVTSNAKVILIGIGADEQMAGYGRHRTTYKKGGYDALRKELAMEKNRLWTRNLGRDDRCISYHGKEARFPFLDEDVVSFLNSLDVEQLCDMEKPAGEGDKMILRLIAKKIGVRQCSGLVKRAIQFGSRIAKVSDTHRYGSSSKASGSSTHIGSRD
jgi:asparagine synthetase B (glutamine-hydrolysing)